MKSYLSYGGGVNSTAMILLLHDEGVEFETVFVDHGCDWPETYDYVYNVISPKYPVTILKPDVEGFDNLYDYCWYYEMVPFWSMRFCTDKFKIRVIQKYVETPCFQFLGISSEEAHRAKLKAFKGAENRFPLIERDIDRDGCKKIIRDHGLPIPMKSGCYFCIFQRIGQWKELRRKHPDLFCKAEQLEHRNNEYRKRKGKQFMGLIGPKSLKQAIREDQQSLFSEMEYPHCNCEFT